MSKSTVVVVTGVSSGIGRVTAEKFSAQGVANVIVAAATSAWKMRRPAGGKASLLNKLRRFMPAGPVDSSLRKHFGLA